MILQNSKISARQLNRLILTAGTGTLMLLLPDLSGSQEEGIAALFVSFGITLVHLKIVFWLVEKEGRSDRKENCADTEEKRAGEMKAENQEKSFGWISRLAAIIEFIKCAALSAELLLAAANTVQSVLLPGKSFALIAAAWLAGAVYLACAGTEARGRFAEAVWLIALVPLAFLLILCLAHIGKHGSIIGEALISGEILQTSAGGILLRGILYSAVFAPVELLYWSRDQIAWGDSNEVTYRRTEHAISIAVCIVFIFALLFTAAAVGILGIQGIQATENSAMAIAAGLDVMGAVVAQKQGIAVLFFLTGMLTASGVLLGQMVRFVQMVMEKMEEKKNARKRNDENRDTEEKNAGRKNSIIYSKNGSSHKKENDNRIGGRIYNRNEENGRKNHVIALCLALLIWCTATGIYGGYVNSASGEQIAEYENTTENTGAADSLNTTAQIEDRAYCTAIGIDLAEEVENMQFDEKTDENVSGQNTAEESDIEKDEITEEDETEDSGTEDEGAGDNNTEQEETRTGETEESDTGSLNHRIWNAEGNSSYIFTIEITQGSNMEASLVICKADSLAEAAAIFNANSSRELDVSHLQILLLGNSLLESECYKIKLLEFGDASEYYFGGTLLAFTKGSAIEYMQNYEDSYDSEGTAVGLHLKKRFEQGLESEKAVLGTVYYKWINHAEEEPAEWIPTLSLSEK